ncbi:class I SAM-dependent methyltransferase [Ferrovibrio sp.]|uniref:class I SAM-dependent methyltransferase n=1 Tax=Ferrovibrio sp. TaxID=1917215 RepID=UPI00311DC448
MTIDQSKLDALVGTALGDIAGAYGGVMISIGNKLGLYRAMAGAGPLSAAELARRAGCAERYVREWLNAQVAGGYVTYHPASQTYELTPEQAMVLADEDSPVFFPNAWHVVASLWADEHKTADAIRTGRGIGWGEHDHRLYCGVAAFFRNGYVASLVPQWLPALDGVVPKLEAGAKVADIGCGFGHSTILMAQAYPQSHFWGFDVHAESIRAARRNAEQAGVADRITFEVAKANDYPARGYDLICFFDSLHDMGHPDKALRHAGTALAPDGNVMLIEPFANDRVEDNVGPVGQLYYSASTALCCAHAISEQGDYVLGAQAGEERLAQVARASGFASVRRAFTSPFNMILDVRR